MQNLILNRYRLLDVAGKGGYGTVQVAWDTRIQRRVAIKCLPLDVFGTAASPSTPRDIPGLDEARTAAMLSDPHIVGVYDFEVEGPMAYLIMEYIDGFTLTELLRLADGMLPLDVLTCVFDSVAHAIGVAHDNQVLHLDIKPDNVLINRQGQVKVADFGLAQLSHEAGFGQAAGGTIGYMPLEQMRLEAPDVRTDEWALAALTYQMLTGDNPFLARDLAGAERAIEEAELVVPSLARDDVGEEVDEAIFGALAIDRDDRFASVALFADAVLPHLGSVRRGQKDLAYIVGGACADDDSDEADDYEVYDSLMLDDSAPGAASSGFGEPLSEPLSRGFEESRADSYPVGLVEPPLDPTEAMPAPSRARKGLADRLRGGLGDAAVALWSGAACAAAAYVGLGPVDLTALLGGTGGAALLVIALAVGVVGAVFPRVGAPLGLASLAAGMLASGSYVLGALFAVAAGAWWWTCGRFGKMQSVVGSSVAALSLVGGLAALPLAAGLCLRVRDALISVAFAVVSAFALTCCGMASFTGGGLFAPAAPVDAFAQLAEPGMWVLAASWAAAAAVGSLFCVRGGRALPCIGMVAATAVLAFGLMGEAYVTSGFATWVPEPASLVVLAVAGVIVAVVAGWLGAPPRTAVLRGRRLRHGAQGNGGSGHGVSQEFNRSEPFDGYDSSRFH